MRKGCVSNIKLLVLLLCISFFPLFPNQHLIQLATSIIRVKPDERDKARTKLLLAFKNIQSANKETLHRIVHAYHYGLGETLLFPHYQHVLDNAIARFHDTPGFTPKIYALLANIKEEKYIKGHMYEIEVALHLDTPENPITHFEYQFHCEIEQVKRRDIDLATKNGTIIECKNFDWKALDPARPHPLIVKIKSQLTSYHTYAQSCKPPRPFTLYSKQPVSEPWQAWLKEQDILYIEYNSDLPPGSPKEKSCAV